MVGESSKRRPRALAVATPSTARPQRRALAAARWLPSARSLAVGFVLLAIAGAAYLVARETSVFGVQRIEVEGAPPALAAQIRTALEPLVGTSLVTFSSGAADRRLASLPAVARAHYDRDFPHTLRVTVRVEEPVAVLRRGSDAWTVSRTGRVLAALARGSYPPLPRIWLTAGTDVTVGLPAGSAVVRPLIAAALLQTEHFRARVRIVRQDARGHLALELGSGREVRLGAPRDLPLKLAVAEAVLPQSEGASYIDVSVPSRAVAGYASADNGSGVPSSDSRVSG